MSWEDDDFEVPPLPTLSKGKFDDEEDEVEIDPVVAPRILTPAEQARREQKLAEEEAALARSLKYALQESETGEDRKARERRQIEEADNALTEELLGGGKGGGGGGAAATSKPASEPVAKKAVASLGASSSLTGGLAAVALNTKQDHTNFGITCSKKLADSTPIYICSFYKALSEKLLPAKMTTESLDEILAVIQKIRDEKKKIEGEVAKSTSQKKTKKELKAVEKKHSDIFGGAQYDDKLLDQYADFEDGFM